MARGESGKAKQEGSGIAIAGLFGVTCVAALTLVATTTRSCTGCVPTSWVTPPPLVEPFHGARAAFELLGWRDTGRARAGWVVPTLPDAIAAGAALETSLRDRGYVEGSADDAPRVIPFEASTDALDGACGVVVILGAGNATLLGIEDERGLLRASDPSVVTVARCGAGTVRVSGMGSATVETWLMPGITPADVATTELSAEIVLAHAEAEALLRPRGYEPSDTVARRTVTGSTSLGPPGTTASGCQIWVGVVEGAGRAETSFASGMIGRDYALDRALFGAATCSTGSTTTMFVDDDATSGLTVVWRPYGVRAGGPTRAPATGTIVPTAGAMRVVDEAHLTLPRAIPSSATAPP